MKKSIGCIIGALMGIAGWVGASVITDNFESYTVGTSPVGQNGWSANNGVAGHDSLIVSTNGLGGGSTKALRMTDTLSNATSWYLRSSFANQSSFQITYDVQLKNLLLAPTLRLNGVSNATAVTTGLQLAMDSGPSYKFSYTDGTWKTIAITGDADGRLDVDAWYTIQLSSANLTGDKSVDTWSLVVKNASGTTVVNQTGLGFKSGMTAVSSADFYFNGSTSGGDMLIDNYTVIPEPATVGMLGLGALLTLALRRRMTR
jgi:hypothetical protein